MGSPSRQQTKDRIDAILGDETFNLYTLSPRERAAVIQRALDDCKPHLKYLEGSQPLEAIRLIEPSESGMQHTADYEPPLNGRVKAFTITQWGVDQNKNDVKDGVFERNETKGLLLLTVHGEWLRGILKATGPTRGGTTLSLFVPLPVAELNRMLRGRPGALLTRRIVTGLYREVQGTIQAREARLRPLQGVARNIERLSNRVGIPVERQHGSASR